MRYIVDLNKDTRWGIDTIGTKAFNLQKMMVLGIRIPESMVVSTSAYWDSNNGEISQQLHKNLSGRFPNMPLPIIARSSSVAEDTSRSSKAGVFTTVSDVKSIPELEEAIMKVWGSSKGEDIAVILQEQLKPEIAGVMFTRDPVTGKGEHVIEFVEGIGESLVSGKRNPIRADKNDIRFKELIKEGERIESYFGYPLDIEWAKADNMFYILQARPITALPVPSKEEHPTYSMILAEQFFSGPSSPLWFSLFKFLFEEYYAGETARDVGLDALPKEPLLIKHKDHMYVNTYPSEYLLRKAGGLGDFQQQLKVLPEDIRGEFESPQQKNTLGALHLLSKIAFLLLKHPNLRKSKVDKEFKRITVPEILYGLEQLKELPKTIKDMEHEYGKLLELTIIHIRSSKWGLAHCIMLSSFMQRSLEKNNIKGPEATLLALMSGLPFEKTSEGIGELENLARKYGRDEYVLDKIKQERDSYEEYRRQLITKMQGRQFIEAFESIIYRFGHRRLARDLIEPSWRDQPLIPFSMLRNLILHQDQYELLAVRERGIQKREETLKEVLEQVPIYKRRRFRSNSNYLIRYLAFRELQRFYLDMILSRMRSLFIIIGESMVKDGFIQQKDDIFFLTKKEIEDYLKGGKKDLRYVAAFRRMVFRESPEKPGLYLRNGIDFNTISPPVIEHINGNTIKGEAVSQGVFKGNVKVIENIDSKTSILPGVVLVTKSIDPGQTQVFTSAGGLILEVGGILSHGAILAREFGIPTVAQVNKATKIFYDGQEVVVNGSKGEVVVDDKK